MSKGKKSSIGFDPLAWMKGGAAPAADAQATAPAAAANTATVAQLDAGDSLRIADVGERTRAWRGALASATAVRIDAGRLEAVDAAGVQLLLAVRREAARRAIGFEWAGVSQALRRNAATLGLAGELGC